MSSELIDRAERLLEVRREAEAAALLAQVLARDPHDARAWLALAQARMLAGDPAEALSAATTAGGLLPTAPAPYAMAGHALSDLGRHAEDGDAGGGGPRPG